MKEFQSLFELISSYSRGDLVKKQYLKLQVPEESWTPDRFNSDLVDSLPTPAWELLGYFAQLQARFKFICPSQFTIGAKISRGDRQVRRYLDTFKKMGLVSSFQRYNNSCLYKIHPIILSQPVRDFLSRTIQSFRFVPLLLLMGMRDLDAQVRLGLSNIYLNKPLEYVSHIEGDPYPGASRMVPPSISPALRSLHDLRLTKWGQIALAAYPEAALLHVYSLLKSSKDPDKFTWFKDCCDQYCYKNGLRIRHDIVKDLKNSFPFPDNARMTFEDKPPKPFDEAISDVKSNPVTGWLLDGSANFPHPMHHEMPDDVARRIAERKKSRGIR